VFQTPYFGGYVDFSQIKNEREEWMVVDLTRWEEPVWLDRWLAGWPELPIAIRSPGLPICVCVCVCVCVWACV
jgi:hypothetical protein